MESLPLIFASSPDDADRAAVVVRDLCERAKQLVPTNFEIQPGPVSFDELPSRDSLRPSTVVLFFVPSSSTNLSAKTIETLGGYSGALKDGRVRLVPIALKPTRNVPPPPLDSLMAFRLHDLGTAKQSGFAPAQVLTHRVLALMALRAAPEKRAVFLSYRIADGRPVAKAIQAGLEKRGYSVWRDDSPDHDGVAQISPGSSVQKEIKKAIKGYGCVLVLDTPQATESRWVHEEVGHAVQYLLPILPVVVDPSEGDGQLPPGGRFLALRDLHRDVRLSSDAPPVADADLDRIEAELVKVVLANLRMRWRVVEHTQSVFQKAQCSWSSLKKKRLLFKAIGPPIGTRRAKVAVSYLVQCAPYDYISAQMVDNLDRARTKLEFPPDSPTFLVHVSDKLGSIDAETVSRAHTNVHVMQPTEVGAELDSIHKARP